MNESQSNQFHLVLINTPTLTGANTIRLGLLTIASYIRQHGFSVMILDGSLISIKKQLIKLNLNNTIIGLTATTDVVLIAYDLCKFIKNHYPDAYCILGGFHATALPEQTLKESMFDLIVFGEGELTVLDILNSYYKNGGELKNLLGTVIRKNGVIIKNKPRELINDLDILPTPAYDLIQIEKNFGLIRYEKVFVKRCLLLLISRGCPFDCVFCDSKIMWKRRLRWHSIDYIIELIKFAVERYNIDSIEFLDDDLLCSKERIMSLTEGIIKTGLAKKIKWECQARATSVDEEKLMMIKEAGCQLVRFGIESGSNKSLAFLKNSTIKVEDCFNAVQLCKKVGLPSFGSFIIGSPEEDVEDIIQTIKFIEKSGLSSAAVFVATPYPGTDLFNLSKEKGYLRDNITWSDYLTDGKDVNPVIRSKYFTAQQLRYIRDYININVIKPLNRGQKQQKLNHRKEIETILNGELSRARESMFVKAMDYCRRGVKRPEKIIPFITKKIVTNIEKMNRNID